LSVARASLLNSHSDVLGNRIERKICKNLPKLTAEKSRRHHHFYLGYQISFFFHSPVFFLSLVFLSFFFQATHFTERFCTSSNITESFVKSETRLWLF
jgi:hypothetical protein